jgi:hypothetical protein
LRIFEKIALIGYSLTRRIKVCVKNRIFDNIELCNCQCMVIHSQCLKRGQNLT